MVQAAVDGWIFLSDSRGVRIQVRQINRGAEIGSGSMESGRLATASSCQKRIVVGFGVALWLAAIRNDDVDILSKGIFETAVRKSNAFRCRRVARTRRSLRGRFRGQAKRGDYLVPCQSGCHRFLHEPACDSTNP
jgi:hypothetical protein